MRLHQVFRRPLQDDVGGLFLGKISCHKTAEKLSQFVSGGLSQLAALAYGDNCTGADPRNGKNKSECFYMG